jgi:hypothetical protein
MDQIWRIIIPIINQVTTLLSIAEVTLRNVNPAPDDPLEKVADAVAESKRILLGVVQLDPTSQFPGQARGLAAISAFCREVIADLDELLAAGPPWTDEQKAAAQALNDSLWDEAKVYQAKRGADAKVLTAAREAAKEKLGIIIQTG